MGTMLSCYAARVRRAVAPALRPNRFSGIANTVASVLVFGALIGAAQPAAAQFVQQGAKLVGSGAVGIAEQGGSVALSPDGSTAIVGAVADNSGAGAAWLYTQSGGVWTQQGSKQVGAGAVGTAEQGNSVALSADGNTAIVGGPDDNSGAGAAWAFTVGGSVELPLGSGAVGAAAQGWSV